MYKYEDQEGIHLISREQILNDYYQHWAGKMISLNREHLISQDNCIEDFCVVHWAEKCE